MSLIRTHIIILILFASTNNSQHWNTTTTSNIIHDVKVIFRSSCIYLMYNSIRQDDFLFLIEVQKLLTLRKIPAAVISLGHYYNYGFRQCHQNRPLNILLFTDTRKSLRQISSKIYLPDAIWILFTNFQWNDTESFNIFFNDMYIPLNTEFVMIHPWMEQHALLSEVYHISKTHPLQKNYFGIWRSETGIIKTDVNFYERRNDLQGLVVKAAAITEPPVTILIEKENKLILYGFFGKIWRELERKMNFTTEYSTPADQAWGTRTSNGSYNGMIGMILKNEVQFAVTEFTMTSMRAEVVDFSIPLIDTRNCVLIRQPEAGEDILWTGFLDPYTSDIWMLIIIIVLAIISFPKIAFWLINRIPMSVSQETQEAYHAIYVIGIFCLQGTDMPREILSLKILYLVAYFMIVTLSVAYSASLISFLTIQKTMLPFNSLRELIDIGTYKLGVLANSGQLNNFNNATEPLMMEAYAKLIEPDKDNLPITIEEGMQRVCDESKYTFMTSLDVVLGSLDLISCKLMSVLGASIPESLAIAIAKKNPYHGLINYNLRVMQRNGILKRLRRQEWPTALPPPITLWKSVNFHNIAPFLIILSGGVLISIVLLIIEQYKYSLTQVTQRDPFLYSAPKSKIFPVASNEIRAKKNNTMHFTR